MMWSSWVIGVVRSFQDYGFVRVILAGLSGGVKALSAANVKLGGTSRFAPLMAIAVVACAASQLAPVDG